MFNGPWVRELGLPTLADGPWGYYDGISDALAQAFPRTDFAAPTALPPDMPHGFVHVNPYSNTIRRCRRRMAFQNPSLQSMSTKTRHCFGNAPRTASTIREPCPLTAEVIS